VLTILFSGFTYGYLRNLNVEDTLRLAAACGTLSLRKHGGTASQPTLNEAKRFVDIKCIDDK